MGMPDDLPSYLKEIEKYLKGQKSDLEARYKNKNRNPSKTGDPFSDLTKFITHVENLQKAEIQRKIREYWEELI